MFGLSCADTDEATSTRASTPHATIFLFIFVLLLVLIFLLLSDRITD